jgi:hypothetical protein
MARRRRSNRQAGKGSPRHTHPDAAWKETHCCACFEPFREGEETVRATDNWFEMVRDPSGEYMLHEACMVDSEQSYAAYLAAAAAEKAIDPDDRTLSCPPSADPAIPSTEGDHEQERD